MDPDELGERDQTESSDFPPSERVIHTQAYDLSLNTLKEQWDDKTLVIPEFQRAYEWDNAKASRLIESLLLNIPIPVLFFAETDEAQYEVVDGHQRVFTIVRYLDNQFGLSGLRIQEEFRGVRFHQLPPREQRFLRTRVMRAIIIGADSSPTMKFEVFERLNTGGLALNAQEVRNALNQGSFNDLLCELELNQSFRFALQSKRPRKRMVDRELVLRFFALHDWSHRYRTPLVRFLNDYMRENRSADEEWLAERREIFTNSMGLALEVLGSGAFRVTDASGTPVEGGLNRALFECEAICFAAADSTMVKKRAKSVKRAVAALISDPVFADAIQRATGDKSRMITRMRLMAGAFETAGVPIKLSLPAPDEAQ